MLPYPTKNLLGTESLTEMGCCSDKKPNIFDASFLKGLLQCLTVVCFQTPALSPTGRRLGVILCLDWSLEEENKIFSIAELSPKSKFTEEVFFIVLYIYFLNHFLIWLLTFHSPISISRVLSSLRYVVNLYTVFKLFFIISLRVITF